MAAKSERTLWFSGKEWQEKRDRPPYLLKERSRTERIEITDGMTWRDLQKKLGLPIRQAKYCPDTSKLSEVVQPEAIEQHSQDKPLVLEFREREVTKDNCKGLGILFTIRDAFYDSHKPSEPVAIRRYYHLRLEESVFKPQDDSKKREEVLCLQYDPPAEQVSAGVFPTENDLDTESGLKFFGVPNSYVREGTNTYRSVFNLWRLTDPSRKKLKELLPKLVTGSREPAWCSFEWLDLLDKHLHEKEEDRLFQGEKNEPVKDVPILTPTQISLLNDCNSTRILTKGELESGFFGELIPVDWLKELMTAVGEVKRKRNMMMDPVAKSPNLTAIVKQLIEEAQGLTEIELQKKGKKAPGNSTKRKVLTVEIECREEIKSRVRKWYQEMGGNRIKYIMGLLRSMGLNAETRSIISTLDKVLQRNPSYLLAQEKANNLGRIGEKTAKDLHDSRREKCATCNKKLKTEHNNTQ